MNPPDKLIPTHHKREIAASPPAAPPHTAAATALTPQTTRTMGSSSSARVALALGAAGMVLLPVFGLLFRFQPSFFHGLHVDAKKAERNCYIAGGMYGIVFLLSGITLWTRACTENRRRRQQEREESVAASSTKSGHPVNINDKKMIQTATNDGSRTNSRADTAIILDSSDGECTPL